MLRTIFLLLLLMICSASPALAVTLDEIPAALRSRLPDVLLKMADPRALAAISLADLEEFASAFEQGELKFVSEVNVLEHSGPIEPATAELLLQVPAGAPYIKERFVRQALQAYGRGVFSKLKWRVHDNEDGSVSIDLWYAANSPQALVPIVGSSSIAGVSAGISYRDYRFQDQDKQLEVWGKASQDETEEPEGGVSYVDNTLRSGKNSLRAALAVSNQWRRRGDHTPARANLRQRTAELDLGYAWQHSARLGLDSRSFGLDLGAYGQDSFVYSGDPAQGGAAARGDFDQAGNAIYARLFWKNSSRDHAFTPSTGWDYALAVEQHLGAFEYIQASADLRRYFPAPNVLGIKPADVAERERINDAQLLFPSASFALQAQAIVADGDVPYSREIRADLPGIMRGPRYDQHFGTKLLALRGEYRLALDHKRQHEAFVFTDHAFYGERLDRLEALDSFGAGLMLRLPVYGGFKVGGWYGRTFNGDDSSYGLAIGYMF